MKRGHSSIDVKKLNRNRIFRYINASSMTSMPDTAHALGMSVPTVLQCVNELKALGVIEEVGEFESTGGRKAKAVAAVKSSCYAVGIDITRNHIGMVLTDLSLKVLRHLRIRREFRKEAEYFSEIAGLLKGFLGEAGLTDKTDVRVGIAVPGIVDIGRDHISFSHALKIRDLNLESYLTAIPYPSVVLNDAKAAVMTECIGSRTVRNMVYLSLSNTVGGAIVIGADSGEPHTAGGTLFMGDNWRSGEFGHMTVYPGGEHCYCGKSGCLDAYCAASRLSRHTDGNLELFMHELEQGSREFQVQWDKYLDTLAIAVDNLRMNFDCEVILGGYVGSHMGPYMARIRELAAAKNIFGNSGDYVRQCRYPIEASALGAAMYQIERYISTI